MCLLQGLRQRILLTRNHKEMNMLRHATIPEHAEPLQLAMAAHQFEIRAAVRVVG